MSHTSIQSLLKQHENLRGLLEKYPSQSSSVCQTLLDLTFASNWSNLQILDMEVKQNDLIPQKEDPKTNILISGLKPESKGIEVVWTCSISDILQTEKFQRIFTFLDSVELNISDEQGKQIPILRDHFLLAVHAPDGTVVYYNLARGLVKPIN